jgi:hypothetical protein
MDGIFCFVEFTGTGQLLLIVLLLTVGYFRNKGPRQRSRPK